jgi:hypothetical protein
VPNNFLTNFLAYAEGCETPELYDLWSAMATMSSLVSRRVWVNQGYFTIYPNLYIVLVGAPGGRKTTSMVICQDILRAVGGIEFAATAMTKEALCKYMSTQCQKTYVLNEKQKTYTPITLCLTELSHFLGSGTQAHMIDFLTTIYDQEVYDAKTKNKGDDIIPGPYLTILACTTPSNITRYLKEDVISGGFSRRTLFAYELDDGDPIAFPEVSKASQDAFEACVSWGKQLQQVAGEFKWTDGARTWYKQWYEELWNSLKTKHDLLTRGYFKSKHIQLLKVAMLVALCESTELTLTKEHLQVALELLNKLETNLPKVYEGMGRNELNAVAAKLLEILDKAGAPVPEKQVRAIMYREADVREILGIIQHLTATGKVLVYDEKLSTGIRRCLTTPRIASLLKLVQNDPPIPPPEE